MRLNWISVDDAQPAPGRRVLACSLTVNVYAARCMYAGGASRWFDTDGREKPYTRYWCELGAPPYGSGIRDENWA